MPRFCPGIFDLLVQVLVISIKKNNAPWVSLMGAGMEKLGAWASALLQDPGVGFKQMCKPCPSSQRQPTLIVITASIHDGVPHLYKMLSALSWEIRR